MRNFTLIYYVLYFVDTEFLLCAEELVGLNRSMLFLECRCFSTIPMFALFLQAYKLDMTRGDYVWMIPFWYTDQWWTVRELGIGCSVQELTRALSSTNILTVSQEFLSQMDEATVSGFVS